MMAVSALSNEEGIRIFPEVFKSAFKRAFTRNFPKEKAETLEGFRGKHEYDKEKCIGCQLCIRICPANAIKFIPKTKKVEYDLGKCVYCGMCEDVCPVKCIKLSRELVLSQEENRFVVK